MHWRGTLLAGLLPAAHGWALRHRSVACDFSDVAGDDATCESLSASWGISVDTLVKLNPGLECPNLESGRAYCVLGTVTAEPTSTSSSVTSSSSSSKTSITSHTSQKPVTKTKASSTTTTSSDPHSPSQSGLAPNCDKFHKVQSGDQCDGIYAKYGISAGQFLAWNPSINNGCTNLWLGYWVCVHIPGAKTTSSATPTPTPTKPDNGIETPRPTQPNMVSYCNKFHYVKTGEICDDITSQNGISLSEFVRWNPSAGNDCRGLWANTYACVGALPAFQLATRYHNDCTGDIHNIETVAMDTDGHCINTDCQAASLEVYANGACPDGEVQASYWEKPGCSGHWFGYGYASRGQCHGLWTDGWKFKSLWIRCAPKSRDCVSQGSCTEEPEPNYGVC